MIKLTFLPICVRFTFLYLCWQGFNYSNCKTEKNNGLRAASIYKTGVGVE